MRAKSPCFSRIRPAARRTAPRPQRCLHRMLVLIGSPGSNALRCGWSRTLGRALIIPIRNRKSLINIEKRQEIIDWPFALAAVGDVCFRTESVRRSRSVVHLFADVRSPAVIRSNICTFAVHPPTTLVPRSALKPESVLHIRSERSKVGRAGTSSGCDTGISISRHAHPAGASPLTAGYASPT